MQRDDGLVVSDQAAVVRHPRLGQADLRPEQKVHRVAFFGILNADIHFVLLDLHAKLRRPPAVEVGLRGLIGPVQFLEGAAQFVADSNSWALRTARALASCSSRFRTCEWAVRKPMGIEN